MKVRLFVPFAAGYVFLLGALLAILGTPALAHDGDTGDPNIEISTIGPGGTVEFDHNPDLDPWKGWFWIKIVINLCDDPWGDFHLELRNIPSCGDSEVVFDPNTAPLSSQTFSSPPVISNGGKTMDIYFYDDPIERFSWGWFKVYTDNTPGAHNAFRIAFYPTPVPEPAALGALCMGGVLLLRRRRRA